MQTVEELPFIAGHPALDFVNTAEERGHPEADDVLRDAADLRVWGQRYGVLTAGDDDEGELARALEARELLYRLFSTRVHGGEFDPADLRRLGELGAEACAAGELAPDPAGALTWRWPGAELASVRHVAVSSAVELLRAEPAARVKQCPGDHCGWFFLDATKRGNRRWCSMSECGQEAKTARRRDRRRRG